MAQLVVRNLEDDVKAKLQKRARQHGHSTEEEVRDILRDAVKDEGEAQFGLGTQVAKRFAKIGLRKGEDIPEQRGFPARPAEFDPLIILDTNVIAALMRRDAPVLDWLDTQPRQSVWTSSVSVYETRFGIEILAVGRRRRDLERTFAAFVEEDIGGRVLPFDMPAAESAGRVAAERRRTGRTIEIRDVQIAGIAMARKATLATRNVRHFSGIGLPVIDPWDR